MAGSYVRPHYNDTQSTARMADMLRDSGAIQAQGAQTNAAIWGGTAEKMGTLVAGAIRGGVEDYARAKEKKQADDRAAQVQSEQDRMNAILKSSIDPNTGRINFADAAKKIGEQIDPIKAEEYWRMADAQKAKDTEDQAIKTREFAKGVGLVIMQGEKHPEQAPEIYGQFRAKAIERGMADPDDLPETYDPTALQSIALQALTADQVFQQLFKAPNAPKTTVLNQGDILVNEAGGTVASNPKPAPADDNIVAVGGHLVDKRTNRAVWSPPREPKGGGGSNPANTNAMRDDMRAAEQWKIQELAKLEQAFRDPATAMTVDELERRKDEIQQSYLVQIGAPESVQRQQAEQRRAERGRTMGDLVNPPQNTSAPSAPMGAGTASAAPPAPAAGRGTAAAMPPRLQAPPEPVAQMLKGQKPGRYTMSDGSAWLLRADGQIVRVQ